MRTESKKAVVFTLADIYNLVVRAGLDPSQLESLELSGADYDAVMVEGEGQREYRIALNITVDTKVVRALINDGERAGSSGLTPHITVDTKVVRALINAE